MRASPADADAARHADASTGRPRAGSGVAAPNRSGRFLPPGRLKALVSIVAGLISGTAVTVVTGPRGVGKTALVDAAVALLADQPLRVIRICSPEGVPLSLSRLTAQVLGMMPDGLAKDDEMRACELLLSPPDGARATVLVIDNAHAMQMDALRLLAMLSSSKRLTGHAVQMLLAGLPELSAALDSDGTPSLHGQAATRVALEPYSDLEARDFADHWLCRAGKAGGAPPVFQDDALREILDRGGGLPGALGSILDAVLKAARGRRRHVTRQMVCRALEPPSAAATVPWHRLPAGKLPLLLVLAVLLAGVAATRMMEHQERPAAAADPPPGHAVNGSVAPAAEQLAGAAAVQPDQEAGAPQPAPPQPVKAVQATAALPLSSRKHRCQYRSRHWLRTASQCHPRSCVLSTSGRQAGFQARHTARRPRQAFRPQRPPRPSSGSMSASPQAARPFTDCFHPPIQAARTLCGRGGRPRPSGYVQ